MKPSRAKTPSRPRRGGGESATSSSASSLQNENSDEVSVFARVRPLDNGDENDERCVEVLDDGLSLQLICPESSSRFFVASKATQFSFARVFDETSEQKEVFDLAGMPLVKDLIQGRNGLLFTYGVTGSGKTHTMQGTLDNGGIMSRAVDVIFNSVGSRLVARKFMVVPSDDKLNDFKINKVVDAATKQQKEMLANMKRNVGARRFMNASDPNLSGRICDATKLGEGVVEDNMFYAVFVSYCEIYNKNIFDLLDNEKDYQGKPKLESKFLKEDAYGNMYVHKATEVEVRSAKDALEVYYRGQKRRRVAETQLNHESSRSHSIFNIRLVKLHPEDDEEIDQSLPAIVSQLSLVDLAGSERTVRTGNTGDRLREAGNINNSLMTLRACIEKLRKNQQRSGSAKERVPYRDDKMTHLFKNYFEGIGVIKMIVCVNPRAADYDENANVLQFAEMAQEVEIERADPVQRQLMYTPARQRVNAAYAEAMANTKTAVDVGKLNPDYSPIYSMGPAWPDVLAGAIDQEETLPALSRFIEQRIATRNTLQTDHDDKLSQFRARLVETEKEAILLREENQRLKAGWNGDKRRIADLEKRLVNAEAANGTLQRRVDAYCEAKVVLENELDENELMLNEQKKVTKKMVKKLQTQLSQEKDRRGKRSFEEQEFKGVGSRIAEMEAKVNLAGPSKKFRM